MDKSTRLERGAFNRPTLQVARALLGKFIVRRHRGDRIAGMIAEVEAYKGPRDRASHAFGGRRTARVAPLYADGGTAYVHLVYGLHWLLNFSTVGEGTPEGVLIRGVLVFGAAERTLLSGPGRVGAYFRIDKRLDHTDVTRSPRLWLEDRGIRVPASRVNVGPRVGIAYAGPYWAARHWRFRIDTQWSATVSDAAFRSNQGRESRV
ncbi:MAG: DNA-3-methyladenine glycosylase [Casimicrobiaceae bacterium]